MDEYHIELTQSRELAIWQATIIDHLKEELGVRYKETKKHPMVKALNVILAKYNEGQKIEILDTDPGPLTIMKVACETVLAHKGVTVFDQNLKKRNRQYLDLEWYTPIRSYIKKWGTQHRGMKVIFEQTMKMVQVSTVTETYVVEETTEITTTTTTTKTSEEGTTKPAVKKTTKKAISTKASSSPQKKTSKAKSTRKSASGASSKTESTAKKTVGSKKATSAKSTTSSATSKKTDSKSSSTTKVTVSATKTTSTSVSSKKTGSKGSATTQKAGSESNVTSGKTSSKSKTTAKSTDSKSGKTAKKAGSKSKTSKQKADSKSKATTRKTSSKSKTAAKNTDSKSSTTTKKTSSKSKAAAKKTGGSVSATSKAATAKKADTKISKGTSKKTTLVTETTSGSSTVVRTTTNKRITSSQISTNISKISTSKKSAIATSIRNQLIINTESKIVVSSGQYGILKGVYENKYRAVRVTHPKHKANFVRNRAPHKLGTRLCINKWGSSESTEIKSSDVVTLNLYRKSTLSLTAFSRRSKISFGVLPNWSRNTHWQIVKLSDEGDDVIRWQDKFHLVSLSKNDSQKTYLAYDGSHLVLSDSPQAFWFDVV